MEVPKPCVGWSHEAGCVGHGLHSPPAESCHEASSPGDTLWIVPARAVPPPTHPLQGAHGPSCMPLLTLELGVGWGSPQSPALGQAGVPLPAGHQQLELPTGRSTGTAAGCLPGTRVIRVPCDGSHGLGLFSAAAETALV